MVADDIDRLTPEIVERRIQPSPGQPYWVLHGITYYAIAGVKNRKRADFGAKLAREWGYRAIVRRFVNRFDGEKWWVIYAAR